MFVPRHSGGGVAKEALDRDKGHKLRGKCKLT